MSLVPWSSGDLADVRDLVLERVRGLLREGEDLEVRGCSSRDSVDASFVLQGGAGGERVCLEARVDLGETGLAEPAARDLALDALDLVLLNWLEGGREERFPGVFEARELSGHVVHVCAERTFPALDAQADALLRG